MGPHTIHYTLLTQHDPNSVDEVRRYSCSDCDLDIFNLSVHAQMDHGTFFFDVDFDEVGRPQESPDSVCGVNGCSFVSGHDGPHSWEPQPEGENNETEKPDS